LESNLVLSLHMILCIFYDKILITTWLNNILKIFSGKMIGIHIILANNTGNAYVLLII